METTKYWKRYEKGRDYLYKKQLIEKTNINWNFYIGRQWEGLQSGGETLPFLNFIKPTVKHKISTIQKNELSANFTDVENREEYAEVCEKLNMMFDSCLEKANMKMLLRTTLKEAAITGDGVQYYGTDNVADVQMINATDVLYGDESQPDIQKQPYIILVERLQVGNVREIARENGLEDKDIELIVPDMETDDLIGNRDEVETETSSSQAKVTCIIHFERRDGVIYVLKSTKNVVYEPEHALSATNYDGEVVKSMTLYPLVKYSWEDLPNSARGVSDVEQLIPNQLEVNKTLARRSVIIRMTAFPRIAYNSEMIQNPDDLNIVGAPIEIGSNEDAKSVNQAIAYLNPAQANSEPKNYADDLLQTTQELSGNGETTMGNINPNRVAASAIAAIVEQSALALDEQNDKKTIFMKELAKLWFELWTVYNPNGFEVMVKEVDEMGNENKVPKKITNEELEGLKPDIRIDTVKVDALTNEAIKQELDVLLNSNKIMFDEYVYLLPENGNLPKNKLIEIVERQKLQQELMAQQQMLPTSDADIMSAWENQPVEEASI